MLSRLRRQLAAVLAISLFLTVAGYPAAGIFASELPVSEEDQDNESRAKISIRSADDLIELSKKSIDEAATSGVSYVLENDIDLEGTEFKPISIFAGYFDGQGHSIRGFYFDERQTGTGFIRTVTKEGKIEDLHVSGTLMPLGDMSEVGGIAGINYGIIENCSFDGYILGYEMTGGIVGHNMESGSLRSCINTASVNATRRTGGVAGYNEGLIAGCENHGSINADKKSAHELDDERMEEDGEEENNLDKIIPDAFDLKDDDIQYEYANYVKIDYTGGIAGVCSGIITESTNYGTVGYPHNGYKTGGIVGYYRGILSGCKNEGTVYGRKDIGGIVGQFEPYAVNIYSEDSLKRAGEDLDILSDRAEKLHRDFGAQDDVTQSHIDAIRQSSDELRDVIKSYKEYYRCKDDSVEREIREKVDNIRRIIDDIDLHRFDKESKESVQTMIDNSNGAVKLIDAAREAMEAEVLPDMTELLKRIHDLLSTNHDAVNTLLDKAKRAGRDGRDLIEDLEDIRSASNDLDDYLRGCVDDYKKDFRITSDDIESRTDRIADQMDILSEGLKDSDKVMRNDLDLLVGSLDSLNDNLSESYKEIQTELQKIYDTDSVHDIFDDISDDDREDLIKGVLMHSENTADIEGDINVGGIAGIITDDPDLRGDFEVVSQGQISLDYNRSEKATILYCRNEGDITVRNDHAGGIVGRADLGAVIGSENFGRIESSSGGYTGGIAGSSKNIIRGCHSRCEAVGDNYAGGIAGLAHSLVGNVALSAVDPEKEYHGAIAGDTDNADLKEEDKGTISGNIFVFRGLGAINGYTEKAEASTVTYEELMRLDGIPDGFDNMIVTFKIDGKTVKRMMVPYGGSIAEDQYPEIPDNEDGQFGYWEEKDLSRIEQDMTLNAVYVDYITSVASDNEERPAFILGGRFYDGTTLSVSEGYGTRAAIPEGYEIYRVITIKPVCEFGIPRNDRYTVRYRMDYGRENDVVLVEKDGVMTEREHRWDGDYMVFDIDEPGTFYVTHTRNLTIIRFAAAAGILAVILVASIVAVLMINRKKEQRKV